MTQKPNGGPAYPNALGPDDYGQKGMTLRDYFAGQALAGYLSGKLVEEGNAIEDVASHCYMTADAMIAAREEGKQ